MEPSELLPPPVTTTTTTASEDSNLSASLSTNNSNSNSTSNSNSNSNSSTTTTSSTKFHSPHLLSDGEILELGIKPSDIELYRRKHYQQQFGIDSWYNITELQQHTCKTVILSLSFEEAEAIVQKHYQKKQGNNSAEQTNLLNQVKERMDNSIKTDFAGCSGVFIKLNTRSPKDATLYDVKNEKIQKLVEQEIQQLDENDRDENNETIAFIKATTKALKVTNGEEAMKLLVSSSRILEDLNKVLPFPKNLFSAKIVLREWVPSLSEAPQGEFRGFVHKNCLNALSQYYSFCYFNTVVERKNEICQQIVSFFDTIKPYFSAHSSYVIDFFVSTERVYIIEINPFHSGAGACLFSWKEDRDLFLGGPFEFRIVERVPENPKEVIPAFWQRFIDDKFHPSRKQPILEEGEELQERKPLWWLWTLTFLTITSVTVYAYKQKRK